jgi:hypothetical protein
MKDYKRALNDYSFNEYWKPYLSAVKIGLLIAVTFWAGIIFTLILT